MKNLKENLVCKIIIALVLGAISGRLLHDQGSFKEQILQNFLAPLGKIFIHMIRMIVVPTVVPAIVVGISNIKNTKQLGNVGLKTIIYFEIVTTIAIFFGIMLTNLFHPGHKVNIAELSKLEIFGSDLRDDNIGSHNQNFFSLIVSVVPSNIFLALTKEHMLPIIFFSILFGFGMSSLSRDRYSLLMEFFQSISEIMFKISKIVMNYAPIGIFSLITITSSTFDFDLLLPLLKLVLLVYGAVIFFALVILGMIARLFRFRICRLIFLLKEELILSFSTASSEIVLPQIIRKMKEYGASRDLTNFIIPTGYSFNLDGSALYQGITVIFLTQIYGVELSLSRQILLIFTLMVVSKGSAGTPGSSFLLLSTIMRGIGLPLEGLMILAGIDRILDMARTTLNVLGNALAVLVISKVENRYDQEKAKRYEKKSISFNFKFF